MLRVTVSPAAVHDVESILDTSQENFGVAARERYEALLTQAIQDVADDPDRPGSERRDEIARGVRTYHLAFSQKRAARRAAQRVKRPRHLLLYRVSRNDSVEISRVLHDSMDLDRHMREEYGST